MLYKTDLIFFPQRGKLEIKKGLSVIGFMRTVILASTVRPEGHSKIYAVLKATTQTVRTKTICISLHNTYS